MTKNTSIQGKASTREARGIALYREHGKEIVRYMDGTFGIPSSDGKAVYHVNLKAYEDNPEALPVCDCPDRAVRCKHVVAATIKAAKLARRDREHCEAMRKKAMARNASRIPFSPEQVAANINRLGA